ncbi:nucleotidyltransferase domain-containing protein [Candidatus Bathyarchaeota archaeon]|nr:nucleotidyltransferase domain-containing protein [Candidatus Bathyarchaeota archaeon]
MSKEPEKISQKARNDKDVLAVLLFGSYARNEKFTDIDVCVVLKPEKFNPLFLSKKRLEYLTAFPNSDIQIYQQLPLYIKMRVLKDGKTIFCRNEDLLYDLIISTVRQFEYFKPRYLSYLEGVIHAR